ncbi:MAG: hypothetical protein NT051_04780 [Candidatus Micrarchaeota archaeon]|nr:hypothetical protein [Candidatus Micrarchaeota archaeon]
MKFNGKGQGATEYLVLLAVVLIIALVSIALLGFFPGIASDAKITQSKSYWSSQNPFAIVESAVTGVATSGTATNGSIILRNNDAGGSMTNVIVKLCSDSALTNCGNSTSETLGSGEAKKLNVTNIPNGQKSGQIYDLYVAINYTTSNGISSMQYGAKTLTAKYV